MTKRWFAAKRYGYGWVPSSIEGWLVIAGFVALELLPLAIFASGLIALPGDETFALFYSAYGIGLACLLIWVCIKKGEKARWRWGQ